MNENLSTAMKNFWDNKSNDEMDKINSKRSNTIKNTCIYMSNGSRSYPCKYTLVLDRLSNGHLIIDTPLNRNKVKQFIGEVPNIFFVKD